MYVYAYVYVYVYVYMYVYVYVYVYVYLYVYVYVYMYVYVDVCMCMCMCMFMPVRIKNCSYEVHRHPPQDPRPASLILPGGLRLAGDTVMRSSHTKLLRCMLFARGLLLLLL